MEREDGERAFTHPRDGHLVYQQTTLKPAHREDLKFVVLIPGAPADAGRHAAIEPGTASPR